MRASLQEEGILTEQQPLYIDYKENKIKCLWFKELFCGSIKLKHINQHVRKSSTHEKKRIDFLKTGGGQRDIREYMSFDLSM